MLQYVAKIWDSRYFWASLVRNDLQMRYRRSMLGVGWSLLQPLAMTLVTCIVFHEIFRIDVVEFAPMVLSGLACWAYLTGVVLQGCQSYVQAEAYIRQHPLPLAVYPLRTTLVAFSHFLIALGLAFVLVSLFRGASQLVALLYVLPGLVLLLAFGWAVALLSGFINVIFRDTQHLLEVAFQVLFYLTPIIYPVEVLRGCRIGWLTDCNPFLHLLDIIRIPLLHGRPAPMLSYACAGGIVLVLGVVAVCTMRVQQRRVILYL